MINAKHLEGRLLESQNQPSEAETHVPRRVDGTEAKVGDPHDQAQRHRSHL